EAFARAAEHAGRAHAPREELLARGHSCAAAARGPMAAGEAIAVCSHALEESGGNLLLEAFASESLGLVLARSGRLDEARELFATARRNRTDLGQRLAVAASAEFAALVERLAGDLESAERELRAGCEALERMGATSLLAWLLGLLAEVVLELGRFGEADRLARRSEELAAVDDIDAQIQWRLVRARLTARAGGEGSVATAQEAVRLALETDALDRQGDAYLVMAEVTGDATYLDEARSCYEQKGYPMPARPAEPRQPPSPPVAV
ncbi:MAG TPA: tetratricopeptide repeat protein, partial [Gaiellaceae bacterium]|nr:tetratricopeptide repeat protein [Gaiellaceae bacterium]